MSYQGVNNEIRKSILILLRPLVQINFFLGTCPCIITPQGQIKTPFKYFNLGRFFVIVGLLIFYSVSSLLQVCVLLRKNPAHNPFQNVTISAFGPVSSTKDDEAVGATLTKFVNIFCGFYSNLVPAVFLCLACCKRKQILDFFDSMSKYVNRITGFGNYPHIKRVTSKLFLMHGTFTLIITTMLSLRLISTPTYGPAKILAMMFIQNDGNQPDWFSWVIVPFSAYMNIAKTMVTAFIEVCCVSIACCLCKVVENIQNYLDDVMRNWSQQFLGRTLINLINKLIFN